jgi:hypothetical protein
MHVRRDLVAGREFQPNHERSVFSRVAVQHRDLRAFREHRRGGRELEGGTLRDDGLVLGHRAQRRERDKREPQG